MKRAICWTTLAGSLLTVVWGLRCAGDPVAGVGTTNGCSVVASVSNVEGSAPPYSPVLLFDVNYIPYIDSGVGIITSADEQGRFRFKALSSGIINVVIMDNSGQNAVLFDSLVVGSGGTRQSSFLSGTGKIAGIAVCDSQPPGAILVYCTGTDFYDLLHAPGGYMIASVPEGTYKIQAALIGTDSAGTRPAMLLRSKPFVVAVLKGALSVPDTLTIR
jgi:hypothetical protein